MAKINIEITATLQEFSTFADELGYQTMITKSPEELALLTPPIAIQDTIKPNLQNKTDFLIEYFKKVTVEELARVKIANIQRQIDSAKETEKMTLKANIETAVKVTSI